MKQVTLKGLYEKVSNLQRDITLIKKNLIEEPELREDFILRMQDIDLEKAFPEPPGMEQWRKTHSTPTTPEDIVKRHKEKKRARNQSQ